jgi:glycerophosphoryl diester phosphodiesterase
MNAETHPFTPLVIAHAACKGHAPENTLAGIRAALELGADGIEIDVQASADGVPILMHDSTVDRTTDGTGEVSKLTLAELLRLDAGSRQFEERFRGERIPTLAEVLELTRGRALLVLEIKQSGIEELILKVVRDLDALESCVVDSFYPEIVSTIRRLEPRLPAALLTGPQNDWEQYFSFALSLNAQGVAVVHSAVDAALAHLARRRKLALSTWTANEPEEMRRLIGCGVDAITTDYPDRLRSLLDR